jgi:hypothetical protein
MGKPRDEASAEGCKNKEGEMISSQKQNVSFFRSYCKYNMLNVRWGG